MKITVAETVYVNMDLPQQTVEVVLDYALKNYVSLSGALTWLNKKGQITLFPKNLDWDLVKFDLDTDAVKQYCQKRNLNFDEVCGQIR